MNSRSSNRLVVHDVKAFQAAADLKQHILKSLTANILTLELDIQARQIWLDTSSSLPPDFSRKYTSRYIQTTLSLESRLAKSKKAKTLTLATKALIKTLKDSTAIQMAEIEHDMQADYEFDLSTEPMYKNLSSKNLAKVEQEFRNRLTKQLNTLQVQMDIQIAVIIQSQPTIYIKPVTQNIVHQVSENSELIELRNSYQSGYEQLVNEIDTSDLLEIQAFEESLSSYSSVEWSIKALKNSRTDLKDQLFKDRTRKLAVFRQTMTMKIRLAKGLIIQNQNTLDSYQLKNLLDFVNTQLQTVIVMAIPRFDYSEILLIIDATFEIQFIQRNASGTWKDFVIAAITAWSNAGNSETKDLIYTQLELYACIYLEFQDLTSSPDIQVPDLDLDIAKLQRNRDTLVTRIVTLDLEISTKAPNFKAPNSKPKRLSHLPNSRSTPPVIYNSIILDSPPRNLKIFKKNYQPSTDTFLIDVQKQLVIETQVASRKVKKLNIQTLQDQSEIDSFYDTYSK